MDRQLLSDQQGGLLQSPTAAATAKYASSQGLSQQDLAAGAQQDTLHTDQQQQQAEQGAPQLTETVALGLQNMEEHRQQLHAMVSLAAAVLADHPIVGAHTVIKGASGKMVCCMTWCLVTCHKPLAVGA